MSGTATKKQLEREEKARLKLEAERERIKVLKYFEERYSSMGFTNIAGVDEAGRGPLAGPVVAASVIMPDEEILYINDSKKLSPKKREELYQIIKEKAVSYGIGIVGAEKIDEINILQATYEAMRMAIADMEVKPDILLNDAVKIPHLTVKQVPIVKGDAKSISIGAASILAKVTRDHMMMLYDKEFPGYGFAAHKGYGTKAHIEAIKEKGPCFIHRKTFITKFV